MIERCHVGLRVLEFRVVLGDQISLDIALGGGGPVDLKVSGF